MPSQTTVSIRKGVVESRLRRIYQGKRKPEYTRNDHGGPRDERTEEIIRFSQPPHATPSGAGRLAGASLVTLAVLLAGGDERKGATMHGVAVPLTCH
jgi:hypothetical protein